MIFLILESFNLDQTNLSIATTYTKADAAIT